jgi:5-(carboxyamino)imidazole ribonucleotide mutase
MRENPIVGIIMGSDSDWDVMQAAGAVLDDLGISNKPEVVSAHRMPEEMVEYAKTARERGLRVIIAGAGGAAHLPGMVASLTTLPVIGVPVPLAQLEGLDSLLSIAQMPAGVPVATVGIGNARNAGLLAARIVSAGTDEVATQAATKLSEFQAELRDIAIEKGDDLVQRVKNQVSQGN